MIVRVLVLWLPVHARLVVLRATVLLPMAVAVLTALRHVMIVTLPSDVIEHRSMLAIAVSLSTHLIHVRTTILWVLLSISIWITVRITTIGALSLVYMLRRLILLACNRWVGSIVATVLRILLAISNLWSAGGVLTLCVLGGGPKSTARALLCFLSLTVPTIVILIGGSSVALLVSVVIGGIIIRRGSRNLLGLTRCLVAERFMCLSLGLRLLHMLLTKGIICFLAALPISCELVSICGSLLRRGRLLLWCWR